jgi:PAS domain S-box-containing protein
MRNPHVPEGIFLSVNASPLRDENGALRGAVSVFRNITQRKLAEEELRKSQERFQLVVQGSQDGLWDWDLTTDEVYYSPRYKAMLGYEDHEFPNRSEEWAKRLHPEDLERVRGELRAHFKGRESLSWVEFRMRHKDGSFRWVRSRAFVLRDAAGRVYRMAGSHEDITDRKVAEEELAYERYLLRSLMDTSPDFIVFKDREGRYIRVNPTLVAKLGLDDPSQAIGKTVHDLFEAEYARQSDAEEQEIIRTGQPVVAKDVTITWPDGRATWGSVTKMPLRDPQGRIIGTFAIARDITERKHAEEELAHERHLLRSFIDALPEGIYFKDRESRIIRANRTVAETVGCTPAQLVGKTDFDLLAPEVARQSFEDEQEIIRTGHPVIGKEEKVTWRDGLTLWVSTTKMPLRDPDGRIVGTFGITRDITKRKVAEEALCQSEERYRSIVAAMQDGSLLLDADGSIRSCNAAAERILGLSAEQMTGRTPHDARWRAIHEDGSPFPGETHPPMVTLRTGQPCADVVMGVHKPDGTLTWITVNSQPLFLADGRTLAGVVASFEDVTDRKRTEEALRRTTLELALLRQRLEQGENLANPGQGGPHEEQPGSQRVNQNDT